MNEDSEDHKNSLDHFSQGELAASRERSARILELALSSDLADLIGRVILWPLLIDQVPARSRNESSPGEPVSEYLICWLLSHVGRWSDAPRPPVTAFVFSEIIGLGSEQIHLWIPARRPTSKRSDHPAETAEESVSRSRESLEYLADSELIRSVGVRFPVEPVLWRSYAASIYEPIEADLRNTLGFDLETFVRLRAVLQDRAQRYMDEHLGLVRAFHKRATALVKRLRQGRTLTGAVDELEARMFTEFSRLTPTESKAAIHWHAMLRILDGARQIVQVTDQDADVVAAVGAEPARHVLEQCAVESADLDPIHYALPNPSPELHYRPLVRVGGRVLVTNPMMLDYYADNIIWTAASGSPNAKKKIENRRAQFTEEKTAECLGFVFGTEVVHRNVTLYDTEAGQEVGEVDVLVTSSAGVIAVECKSSRWSRSAQRGSVARIRHQMKELYFEALHQVGEQMWRARTNPNVRLRDALGEAIQVDWSVRQIGLVIHLDPIDTLQASSSAAPESEHESHLDGLMVSGLPYLDTACHTLKAPGFLLDYFLQRSRVSADKRAVAADENEWLAFYLESGLRIKSMSEQGATLGYLSAETSPLDDYVRSGYDPSLRPRLPVVHGLVPVIESIDDDAMQYKVVAVLAEQSDENNRKLEQWIAHRGRDPSDSGRHALYLLYSADGSSAVALYTLSNALRSVREGPHVESARKILEVKERCTSCTFIVVETSGAGLRAREVFELLQRRL